jgi:hypothetical protein
MLNAVATSSLVSATDATCTTPASYMYQYDPFVQRMFEYSTALEPSAAGNPFGRLFYYVPLAALRRSRNLFSVDLVDESGRMDTGFNGLW